MTGTPPTPHTLPPGGSPPVEWFIGRDGKQFGPVTDAEFRKLIELGHLRRTDMVWREGFPEWRSAHFLIDAQAPPAAPPAQGGFDRSVPTQPSDRGPDSREPSSDPRLGRSHAPASPVSQTAPQAPAGRGRIDQPPPDDNFDDEDDIEAEGRLGRRLKIASGIVFFAASLAAAGWFLLPYRDALSRSVAVIIPQGTGKPNAAGPAGTFPPLAGFMADAAQVDGLLQGSALFQLLKRTHADWYGQRVTEISKAVQASTPEPKIIEGLVQALAQLRRQHAGDVLSASSPKLTAVAATFVTNLGLLRGVGVDACFKFISNGETAPGIVQLFQSKDLSGPLQRQLLAVFLAVEEGRSTPRVYPMPRQADYTALLAELEARGWTQADMQLFSDSRALAKAAPQDVCRLVTEWFESQLALKDADIQLRLIADSLKPLIAG